MFDEYDECDVVRKLALTSDDHKKGTELVYAYDIEDVQLNIFCWLRGTHNRHTDKNNRTLAS